MKQKIQSGLTSLLLLDEYLLKIDVNERAITHRLGMYYQALFPEWDVDCEYNKNGDRPKKVEMNARDMLARMAKLLKTRQLKLVEDFSGRLVSRELFNEEIKNLERQLLDPHLEYDAERGAWDFLLQLLNGEIIRKTIVPDIIIHKRGEKNNYIVIEAKKTSTVNVASMEYDILKLQSLIKDKNYNYKQGYFLDLPVANRLPCKSFTFARDLYEKKIQIVTPR